MFVSIGEYTMYGVNIVVLLLVLVGALNWGLIGFFNYNLVSMIFGGTTEMTYTMAERVVYAVVGLAGLWGLSFIGRCKALCGCDKDNKNRKDGCCRK